MIAVIGTYYILLCIFAFCLLEFLSDNLLENSPAAYCGLLSAVCAEVGRSRILAMKSKVKMDKFFHAKPSVYSECFHHTSRCSFLYFYVSPRFISSLLPHLLPLLLQESEFDSNKQPDSPSEEDPTTPQAEPTSQNPKYELYLNNGSKTNGVSGRDADGPGGGGGTVGENGPRPTRWESNRLGPNHYRGSLESLASRDWDSTSDRVGEADRGLCVCVCMIQIREIRDSFYDNQISVISVIPETQNQLLNSAISWTKQVTKICRCNDI